MTAPHRPKYTREFGSNLRSWFGWRRTADDVREELRIHEEMRVADGGPPASTAHHRQVVAAGAAMLDRADRASRRMQWLEEARDDLRFGWQAMRRRPGFALGSILIVAMGLGANTAIFGLVNAVYFRPLPIDPDGRLVRIREFSLAPDGSRRQVDAGKRAFDAVTATEGLVQDLVITSGSSLTLMTGNGPERVPSVRVSAGFTRVLSTAPILGRPFTAAEEEQGEAAGVLLLSHRLWTRSFGQAADILGRQITAGERTFSVVGVMPAGFGFPYDAEVWVPARFADNERSLAIFGHLAPGITLDAANERFETIGQRVNEELGASALGLGLNAVPARQALIDDDGRLAVALLGSVGFLLLIACANVTMLLTARLIERRKEVVIRASLGCGRGRQIRQFITETLLLFVLGGAAGWLLALVLRDSLVVLLPRTFAEQLGMTSVALDGRVAGMAITVAILTGLGFGLLAALRATYGDLTTILNEGGRSVTGARSRRTTGALVVVEIALALVLLAGAGLLIQTVYAMSQRSPGFRPDGLLTFQMEFRGARYADGPVRQVFLENVATTLERVPGVERVGLTSVNPFCCGDWGARMTVEGQPAVSAERATVVQHMLVTPGFFEAMQIPLRAGRVFTNQDREGQPLVVVIDEHFARRFWPDGSAIGKRVKRGLADAPNPWMTVIGVVAPITKNGEYTEMWYLPFLQFPLGPSSTSAHAMVRARNERDPVAVLPLVRQAIADVDPTMPVFRPDTMVALGRERYAQDRLGAEITAVLAAAGLLLAIAGVYGLMAAAVAGETRELGIRIALGATRARIVGGVLLRALRLATLGAAFGLPLAWISARGLQALVADLAPLEPVLLSGVAGLLVMAVMIAALLPARRAMRIDPLRALRD